MDATELSITRLSVGDLAAASPLPRPGASGTAPIQVWMLGDEWLAAAEGALAGTLSHDERRRCAAFSRRRDAQRFAARRGLLRHLLARYQGCDTRELDLIVQVHGKPALSGAAGWLQFSVAQTDGAMALAFSVARPIGVDVQCRKRGLALDDVSAEAFSTDERADLQSAMPQDRAPCFFDTWTRKEALLKALGIGLLTDARQYTTRRSECAPRWRAWQGSRELLGWTLLDLRLGVGLHAAVAVQPSTA